jgi:hypothetical protein
MSDKSGHGKPTQCRATSKQRKRAGEEDPRCRRYATPGRSLCTSHGSSTEGVPCLANVTHGLMSKYIKIDDVPAITVKIEQAKTVEGRADLLARNAALLQHRLEQVPVALEHMQLAAGGAEAVRRQLETLASLDSSPQQLPVFVVAAGPTDVQEFMGRTADSYCRIRVIGSEHWAVSDDGMTMHRAVKQIDDGPDGSGAEWYAIESTMITDGTDRH